jgi:hypothetical protein
MNVESNRGPNSLDQRCNIFYDGMMKSLPRIFPNNTTPAHDLVVIQSGFDSDQRYIYDGRITNCRSTEQWDDAQLAFLRTISMSSIIARLLEKPSTKVRYWHMVPL